MKISTKVLSWGDFKIEFENNFYLTYHKKIKE
jgi:hypothetical protein